MRIAILMTALMLSAFAFVLLNNGGQITNVNAVVTIGGDDDDNTGDDFECMGDDGDDGTDDADDPGDGQDEDGEGMTQIDPPSLDLSVDVEGLPTPMPSWDGNDDQLEFDDCVYPTPSKPEDYGSCDDPPGYPGAYFYYEKNYEGECFRISGDTPYFAEDNDQASSIKLVGIGSIIVCQHVNYLGECPGVDGDIPDLDTIGRNDDLSSAKFDGPAPTPTPNPGIITAGSADANCDGNVSGQDAVSLLLQIAGVNAASDSCTGGDANCSGWIDPSDVAKVLRVVAGLDVAC